MKIAILFNNYGPYHLARIKGVYQQSQHQGWEVVGIELSRSSTEYLWHSQIDHLPFTIHSVLSDRKLEQVTIPALIQQLYRVLAQVQPDVVAIAGYAQPCMIAALAWSRWHGKPAILLSESTEADCTRSFWKEQLKQWIVSHYQAALVGGQPQKRYLMKLGMTEEAIALGYNVVGNEAFNPEQIHPLPNPLQKPYFLTVNRFIAKKNLPFVIDAYAAYRQMVGNEAWDLVLCGDGELRSPLIQQIQKLGLENSIHLPGFLQQNEQLPYLAHASCFIHASTHEQWGLVVNEAMAAGLPVLVSNRCGCFEDLVIEGENGFGFDPENCEQLTQLMLKVSHSGINLSKMGQAALEHIQTFSPAYFASGMMQAIAYATRSTNPVSPQII